MERSQFDLPKPFEKLSHKFILDALRNIETHPLEPSNVNRSQRSAEKVEKRDLAHKLVESKLNLELEKSAFFTEPAKKYFRIGEVAEVLRVEPYVVRYWESEFSMVKPMKSGSGHRVYSRKDVEMLLRIRGLLYEDKFSIEGAKRKLREYRSSQVALVDNSHQKNQLLLKSFAKQVRELISIARGTTGTFN